MPVRAKLPDKNDKLWAEYLEIQSKRDEKFLGSQHKLMDAVLVFAGLLSAVNTSFVLKSQEQLSPRSTQDTTNELLRYMTMQLGYALNITDEKPTVFQEQTQPEEIVIAGTVLYHLSPAFSIFSAAVALHAKLWLLDYEKRTNERGSVYEQSMRHQHAAEGLSVWRFHYAIQCPVILLLISIYLFMGAFSFSTYQLHYAGLSAAIEVFMLVAFSCVTYTAVFAEVFVGCPYRNPIAHIITFCVRKLSLLMKLLMSYVVLFGAIIGGILLGWDVMSILRYTYLLGGSLVLAKTLHLMLNRRSQLKPPFHYAPRISFMLFSVLLAFPNASLIVVPYLPWSNGSWAWFGLLWINLLIGAVGVAAYIKLGRAKLGWMLSLLNDRQSRVSRALAWRLTSLPTAEERLRIISLILPLLDDLRHQAVLLDDLFSSLTSCLGECFRNYPTKDSGAHDSSRLELQQDMKSQAIVCLEGMIAVTRDVIPFKGSWRHNWAPVQLPEMYRSLNDRLLHLAHPRSEENLAISPLAKALRLRLLPIGTRDPFTMLEEVMTSDTRDITNRYLIPHVVATFIAQYYQLSPHQARRFQETEKMRITEYLIGQAEVQGEQDERSIAGFCRSLVLPVSLLMCIPVDGGNEYTPEQVQRTFNNHYGDGGRTPKVWAAILRWCTTGDDQDPQRSLKDRLLHLLIGRASSWDDYHWLQGMRHLEHTNALLQGCTAPCLSNEERLRGFNDVGALWRGDYILYLIYYQQFFKKFSGTLGEILQSIMDDDIRMELSDVDMWTAIVLKMNVHGNEVFQEASFRLMVENLKHVSSFSGDQGIDDAEKAKRRVLTERLEELLHRIDAYNLQPRESLFQRLWHSNKLISILRNNTRNEAAVRELEMQPVPNQE